jgi:tetratricopeptide (TPR) repeat protein
MIYFKQNEYFEAIKFHHKSLDIQLNATIFLPDYEMLAFSFWNLALAYYGNEQNSEAFDYFQEALAIRKNILPSEHALIKNICNMIACI